MFQRRDSAPRVTVEQPCYSQDQVAKREAWIEIDCTLRRERGGVGRTGIAAHDSERIMRIRVARVERDRARRGVRSFKAISVDIIAPAVSDHPRADPAKPDVRLR